MQHLTRLAGLFHQETTVASVLGPPPESSQGFSPLPRLSVLLLLMRRNPLACAEGAGVGGIQMQKEHKRSASGIPAEPGTLSLPW